MSTGAAIAVGLGIIVVAVAILVVRGLCYAAKMGDARSEIDG